MAFTQFTLGLDYLEDGWTQWILSSTCSSLIGFVAAIVLFWIFAVVHSIIDSGYRQAVAFGEWSYHEAQRRCDQMYDHWFPLPLPPIDERTPASPILASAQRLAFAKVLHHRLGINSPTVRLPWDLVISVNDQLYDEDYIPTFEGDSPSSDDDDIGSGDE